MNKNAENILFVVNNAAFFVSHRLPIAEAIVSAGGHVSLAIGSAGHEQIEGNAIATLRNTGIKIFHCRFVGSSLNPFIELLGLLDLIAVVKKVQPSVVHAVSPKGVIYGGLVAKLCGVRRVVLAISGMGYIFTGRSNSLTKRFMAGVYSCSLRLIIDDNVRIIVQNATDAGAVENSIGAKNHQIDLIGGSGVNISEFDKFRSLEKREIVLLPARLIRDKGICEFVAAVKILKTRFPAWQFLIAGVAGYDNPSSISESEILGMCDESGAKWLGHVESLTKLYCEASIVCLPSYREGFPKALMEAACAECAVVTTDVPGCRDAVMPDMTALLVPPRTVQPLAAALERLMLDRSLRATFGREAAEMAKLKFSIDRIVAKNLEVYEAP